MGDLLGIPRVASLFPTERYRAIKRAWARVVLGWVTSWEVLVLHLFFRYRAIVDRATLDRCDHTSTNAPDPIRTPQLSMLLRDTERVKSAVNLFNDLVYRAIVDRATLDRCDHTSTNASDPIRTPQLSVLGRE
ncbi:hypothetical protein CR513_10614, partial [Mucuna pruriens]